VVDNLIVVDGFNLSKILIDLCPHNLTGGPSKLSQQGARWGLPGDFLELREVTDIISSLHYFRMLKASWGFLGASLGLPWGFLGASLGLPLIRRAKEEFHLFRQL
jgi:hypothetical protein